MEQLTCFYHPNREATQKCSRCGKFLCLECQKKVTHRSSQGGISERVYCPECGKKTIKVKGIVFVVGVAIMITLLIVTFKFLDII